MIAPPKEERIVIREQESNPKLVQVAGQLHQKYLKNQEILLIQTPQFLFESCNLNVIRNRGYYAYPPTGLQCLAKELTGKPVTIRFLDLNYELLKRIISDPHFVITDWLTLLDDYLKQHSPSIIGLTSLTAYGDVLNSAHPLTAILHHLQRRNDQVIIIGGPTATNEFENYLKNNLCHFVLTKEGEGKIRYLLDILLGGTSSEIPARGIYFKFANNIEQTEGERMLLSLRGNLIETYRSIPIENYQQVGCLNPYSRMAGQDVPYSVFQLHRGCRANCRFCDVSKFMGRGIRHYPVDDVFGEIRYLVEQRGIRHFEVLDDDFLGDRKAVVSLLQQMIPLHQNYGITWSANNGLIAAFLDEELLQLIADSGCIGFRIGIESGNEQMLRRIRKPTSLSLLRQKKELLQKLPTIFVGANYILGLFSDEIFGQMMDTFRLAVKMNLDWSSFSVFQFTSKETAIIENLKSRGGEATNFTPSKDNKDGEIHTRPTILSGWDVFSLPPEEIPSSEQVKQIWFTFNLLINYINNKNLRPAGNPELFLKWVEAVAISYPQNPYMPLFSALASVLLGDSQRASHLLEKAKYNVRSSTYWDHRFKEFELHPLLEKFPSTPNEVYQIVDSLWKKNKPDLE